MIIINMIIVDMIIVWNLIEYECSTSIQNSRALLLVRFDVILQIV